MVSMMQTQTKQTQKYLDAEPNKKSAYDQAVNAAKAILTRSGQNVDKAAVEGDITKCEQYEDGVER